MIAVAFVLTAGLQAMFARRYWIEDKRVSLQEQAQTIAAIVSENVVKSTSNHYYISDAVRPTLAYISQSTGADVLVVDNQNTIVLCSHRSCTHTGQTIASSLNTVLAEDTFFRVSRLGDLYDEQQYVAGVVLVSAEGDRIGHVLVSAPATLLGEYILENLQTYLLSAVAVLMVAFIVLYILTYHSVRPLREMAVVTRQFSNGDFSGRVHVRGNDEIAELATALNNMAVSLSSLEDMRRSFVANVSHDLKTPMTTISGFIDGILDGTIPAERRDEYLRIVSDETKRLSRLVGVMLNLSRIDSGQMRLTPVSFDLTAMVCATLVSFEQRIEKKQLLIEGIDACEPQTVYGDYDLLQQVVYNLLDNAVKFTDEGGAIRLFLTHAEGRTVCAIRNTGAGIPAEELPHIFERFYKSDRSRSLDTTGTGLGLYIVKAMLNLHGGEITVRSVEGEFCEFTFWLPDLQKK